MQIGPDGQQGGWTVSQLTWDPAYITCVDRGTHHNRPDVVEPGNPVLLGPQDVMWFGSSGLYFV